MLDYDYDHPHWRTSFEIGASGADYAAALRYNTATGRPLGVTVTGVDVEFSYVSNSHLLDKLEFSEAGTSTVIFERDYTWDANANRVTGIEHTWDPAGTPVEKAGYEPSYTTGGELDYVVRTGQLPQTTHTAVDNWTIADGKVEDWVVWDASNPSDPFNAATGTELTDTRFDPTYDAAGLRKQSTKGSEDPLMYVLNDQGLYKEVCQALDPNNPKLVGMQQNFNANGQLIELYMLGDFNVNGITRDRYWQARYWQAYDAEVERLQSLPRGAGGSFYLTTTARVSKRFFLAPDAAAVTGLGAVATWVNGHETYTPAAKNTFLQIVDYDLVAQALAGGHVVVTHEKPENSVHRVKIPNVCIGVGVRHITPFGMLRRGRARCLLGECCDGTRGIRPTRLRPPRVHRSSRFPEASRQFRCCRGRPCDARESNLDRDD